MKKVRIAAVSYLNTLPFVTGLRHAPLFADLQLMLDTPAGCTQKLIHDEADIGLVPVAALFRHRFEIVSDYCIGADGRVESVLLLGDVPIDRVESVLLDYQSVTSVVLARLLADRFWKISPRFVPTVRGYESSISGTTAGVVIGDRALVLRKKFRYAWDLAAEWKKMTGLPFVFACWACRRSQDPAFLETFNQALANGIARIGTLSDPTPDTGLSPAEQVEYLLNAVSYRLDDRKKEAMKQFEEYAAPYLELSERAAAKVL